MKPHYLAVALAAILASAACNAEKGNDAAAATTSAVKVAPPKNGDWSTVVTQTPAGGFLMGNPNATVKLVEIGALTCPHCREFDETGAAPLIDNYVKSGRVSWEFRTYLLNGLDIPAALIARCNGPKTFFPLMRAIYKDQPAWIGKIQSAPQAQLEQVQNLPPNQQWLAMAKLAGLQQWAAQHGIPSAKSNACLANQAEADKLVQMNSDVVSQYPGFRGTPSFILNGKLLDTPGTWKELEPQLRAALGERG